SCRLAVQHIILEDRFSAIWILNLRYIAITVVLNVGDNVTVACANGRITETARIGILSVLDESNRAIQNIVANPILAIVDISRIDDITIGIVGIEGIDILI